MENEIEDPILAKLNAQSAEEEDPILAKLNSPKSTAPSQLGGKSGAQKPPLASTSTSSESSLGSWTTEANPLKETKPITASQTRGAERTFPISSDTYKRMQAKGENVFEKDGKFYQTKSNIPTASSVQPKKVGEYQPLVQENIQKIDGMTMGVKFPEYSKPSTKQTFDFKQASQEVISEKEQAERQESLNRKEQRRIESLPSEIESLRNERADLLLDKSPQAKRKLAANEAVTQKMQSDLDNISKSKYESLQNLNQKAVKGVELELNEYLDENPKLRDEIKVKGLTDTETYNLVQQSVAKKIAPLEADLQIFQQEGTVDAAKDKIKISNELHARQEKIEGLAGQLKSYQDDYLKKAGFSDLNNQLNSSMESLKKYEPALNKAKAEVSGYEKELNQIKSKLDTYQSKVQGNSFNGTQQEFNEYKALEKDYNETINDLNNVYKNEALNGYEAAVNNYNSLAAKRSSIVKGLNNNEYNTIKGQYDTKVAEYDLALNDYKKFEEPEIKDRINKYFSTIQKIGEYDQKVKTTRGELASIDELEKAKKTFSNAGGGTDVLDIGGRAVNSILDAAKKLIASPFRIAGSMSDVYGSGSDVYHYSDFVADLIEGKGSEPLFLTKEKNVFYDAVTDKINWGVVPILSSVADQAGVLLVLALTGKYATPTVQGAMTKAGADLTAAAEIAESAKIATTIAPAFMISYGDNYKEALDKGFSAGGAMAYSGALSFLEGLTETILPDQDLIFGKGAKEMMLNRFIKDYAKGKNFAIKNLVNDFAYNALGESTEEGIAALGKTLATSIGHLVDNDIEVEIPTINQSITTSITAGLSAGVPGLIGSAKENSQMYKMGVMQFANDFEAGKALLSKLNEKGKIDDKRYNKLISDVQKFQSVRSQIPQGLSNFKTMAIAEKMIAIRDLSAQMNDDKLNPFNKINAKKIDAIQGEIEQIIDDKNFDARAEYELNLEAEELGKPQEEKQETAVNTTLKKNTSPTSANYGTINRNDGKGVVSLTKEEYEAEQAKMQPKADGTAPVEESLKDVDSTAKALKEVDLANSNIPLPQLEIDGYKRKASENYKLNDAVSIAEAYHIAKSDGSNPELVKAVEELLTPKTKTNEKANEDGEQKRGKDGEEDVTESVQSEGEVGGNEVDLKEKQVLGTEGAVTAAPNEAIEKLRAEEQEELNAAIPNSDKYKTDGKVDRNKLTDPKDIKAFDEIYDKYDKLITASKTKQQTKPITNEKSSQKTDQEGSTEGSMLEEPRDGRTQDEGGKESTELRTEEKEVEPTQAEATEEATPKDKVWSKTKVYNNLTKTERKSTYGSKLRSEIMSEAAALGYTVKPTKQGKYILVDEKGKEIRNVGTPRSKDAIQEEKRKKERRSRARRELPISVKHSVAQDIANGVQFDREELKKVTGLRDNEIPFWMTRTDGKGETLEFYNQKYQEKGGAYVEDDMDFQSQVGDAIGDFAHKQGRTSALEYIESIQEKLENGGLTDAEMKEQAAEYQAELDEANFDYFAEYLSNLSDAEAQQLADQLREAEAQENQLIINEILNENGSENKGEAEQGKQKTDTKTPDTKGKSETITALEEELSNIEKEIAKKQAAMQKLTKDEQADMFAGAKIQMFDNAEILKNLTNEVKDLRQKANEVKAKIEIQLEKEANPVVEQPKNQLDIEKEAKKAAAKEKLTDPKNASDLAKTYRNKFKFSPKQSVWAARLFDAKAAFMSKVLGISKEDYYSQYWFGVNEGEGGLSQSERNKNALSSVEETAKELKGANIGNVLGGIKIFRGQQKGMTGRWFTPSKKFAEIFSNSVKGKAKLDAEVIEQTVLGNVLDFPYNVTEYARISDKLADMFGVTQQEIRDALSKTNESLGKGEAIRIHALLEDKNFGDLLASKGIDYVKAKENLTKTESVDTFLKISNKPQEQLIAEAYHKAKIDGSNPALVESLESVIAEKIANQEGGLSQVEAWHGSPYSFDKFTTEKIGTGEGAQSFGWGLYFTDLEGIARDYAEKLAKAQYDAKSFGQENTGIANRAILNIESTGSVDNAINFLKDLIEKNKNGDTSKTKEILDFIEKNKDKFTISKNIYKVSLHKGKTPDQYTWLEWDKKLTEQQSAKIIDALKKEGLDAKKTSLLYDAGFGDKEEIRSENGKGVYTKLSELLGGDKQASLFLLKNGIDGVKYPAESIAMGRTSDTARGFNYVVFDESAVTIEEAKLFQDRKGSWTKDAARMKRIINMYEKADSTTAVHEMLGHDYLDRIIEASATNKEFEADLRTIAEEYIKGTKSKEKVEDIIKALKDFDVEKNKTAKGTSVHEWFARTAEGYFIGETQVKQGSKLAKIFEAFRAHLVELYNNMTNKSYLLPSNEMKKVFRKVFGEEHFDMLNEIAQEEIIQTKKDIARAVPKEVTKELANEFEALRKQAKGLGQTEEVSFDKLLAAAQWLSTQEGVNILSVLPELKAMFPANEQMINENTKDFQQFFTPRGKKVSQTAQSAFDSPIVSEEGKQFVGDRLALYTPEKLKEVLSDVRKAFEDYSIENMMDAWLSGSLPYKELPVFLTELQFRVNRAIKATENGTKEEKEYRKRLISYEQKILDKIIEEGKSTAQRLNYFKIFKGMSTEGKIMHLKRNFNKANEKTKALLDQAVKSLKEKLGKAYEDIDYFFSQNQEAEEKIGSLTQEVSDLNKQIEARVKRKDRERIGSPKRPENFKNKISVSDALAKYKKAKGLGQDLSSLSEQQTLAYALMQEKSKTIEQFVKEWNKVTGEKRDINELEETYKAVRQFAIEVDGFEKDWFDTDSMIDESIEDYTNFKNDVELKKAKKDLELEIAKAEVAAFKKQMSDKDKEVKAREALKKREKQIVNDFLNSLGQDGLWQKYVQSNAGKIIGNLASKIGGKPSEKALLDKFVTLATNEINNAINELTPNQKAQKTTPNYAQQLGDLISNQDKVAEVFDKAVNEFAEQHQNDVNAQALLSKLSGLKNPFSEGLLGKALEAEAKKLERKIGDYAFKYAGVRSIARRQFVGEILKDSELQGAEFDQLKQDLYDKFNAIISETETDVAGQLATALIADSKKTLGLMPKQSDYVKELLGYLKNKAKDYYKSETNKTLVDPIDQLKYAVEMLNDRNGKKIWDDSKAEIIKKIDADKTLSQTEKDNLKQHLDNYQNTVLDQLLSSNKLFNNIKQVIINETPFVKNGAVDWNKMITQAKGNVAVVKDIIRRSIDGKVQGYNTQQVDAVLDAIGREFDARINEKKADIIEKQLESIQGGKIIRQKKIAKGKVQKLIELENSGALDDGRFEQELGKYLGMKEMTPQKWARLRELIIDAEEAPEGNERDRAIEKMAAYVKLNSVGKTAEIYTALYYAGMLARPTTIIKNATGISEPIIRLMYKALTDRKYAKMMIEGLKRGDAKDIWGGGIVQGSKLDEEVGIDGLPRVNILSQMGAQTNNKFAKFVAGGSKILDLLTMADAISQAMVGSGAEYGNFVNYLLEENKEAIKLDPTVPVLTKKQAREQAFNELTNSLTFDGAMMEAKSEFAKRGIIPSEARLKRRAYELTREMILPTQVRELAQQTALEEAYKSKLPSIKSLSEEKETDRRLTENAGLFTYLGSGVNEIVQALSNLVGGGLGFAARQLPISEARGKKLDENLRQILAQRVLPFARGMSNVMEQALEKTPYGILKGGMSLGLEYKNYRKTASLQEAVEHKYMMDRAKDKIAKSAASMILGGIFYSTVMAISRAGDDDEPERLPTGFYSAGEIVKYGKNNIEKFTFPANCMVIGGRVIPLSLLGTQGIGATIVANMYDNFIKKAEKQADKTQDPENIENIKGYNAFMLSMGNTVLSMSAYSSLSELSEAVSPTSNNKMSDYLSQMAVKSAVLPIPYVGTFGQVAQGARYLLGDKSAQTAIGLDERAWKEFGLQGIAYDRPVYNYRGKIVLAPQRNTEGIAGFVGIADKWKLDPIDNYLYKELNYNPTLDKRLSEDFADKENYGMTKEEYYDYGKKVGDEFNASLEKVFPMLKSFDYPKELKQYFKEKEGYTDKDVANELKLEKRKLVSSLQNAIEQKNTIEYQKEKGIINQSKYEIEMTLANIAKQNAEILLMGYTLPDEQP